MFSLSHIDFPEILNILEIIFNKNPLERQTAGQLLNLNFFKQKGNDLD